ncbi:hypothetical protein ACFX2B_010006 [Malus domestica]
MTDARLGVSLTPHPPRAAGLAIIHRLGPQTPSFTRAAQHWSLRASPAIGVARGTGPMWEPEGRSIQVQR